MTPEEKLKELVKAGCVCESPAGLVPVAAAGIVDNQVWWVNQFAESQEHCHIQDIVTAEVVNEHFVVFTTPVDRVYFGPPNEWPELDYSQYRDERGRWLALMDEHDERKQFESFYKAALEL